MSIKLLIYHLSVYGQTTDILLRKQALNYIEGLK